MKDTFYKIWLALVLIIACVMGFAAYYAVQECNKVGGRYMQELLSFGTFECVLP